MTSDDFSTRFRLLEQVSDSPVRTFHAVSNGGTVVMAHFLDRAIPGEAEGRLRRLEELAGPSARKLLEVVDVEGTPVVVTKFILEFSSFDQWLDSELRLLRRSAPSDSAGRASPAAPTAKAGEFTAMFAAQAPPATPESSAPAPPPAPAVAPGEFTGMFAAPAVPPASAVDPQPREPDAVAPAPPRPASVPGTEPPSAPSPQASVPEARVSTPEPDAVDTALGRGTLGTSAGLEAGPPPAAPGEFTRMFSVLRPDSLPAPAPADPAPGPVAAEPVPFWSLESAASPTTVGPEKPAAVPERPARPDISADSANMPLDPQPTTVPAASPAPPPAAPPPAPPRPTLASKSGEFTAIFGAPVLPTAGGGTPPPNPAQGSWTAGGDRYLDRLRGDSPHPAAPPPTQAAATEPPLPLDPLRAPPSPVSAPTPGDYTRVISAPIMPSVARPPLNPPAPPPSPAAAPASLPAAPKAAARSGLPLLIGLAVVVLLALALILYLALR